MDTKQETLLFNCLAELYLEADWASSVQQAGQGKRREAGKGQMGLEPGEEAEARETEEGIGQGRMEAAKEGSVQEERKEGEAMLRHERMEKRVRAGLQRSRRRTILKRAAIVILAVFVGGTGLLLTNESVRAGIMRFLWKVYPNGVVYYFYRDKSQWSGHFRLFEPTWVPEGYRETERLEDEFSGMEITYEKEGSEGRKDVLHFNCENERRLDGMIVPVKNATAQKVVYQGDEAEFYETDTESDTEWKEEEKEQTGENAFVWRNSYGCLFELRGKLGLEEFQKIADSLVEREHVPAVEVSIDLEKDPELVADWPALLDKEGIGYDFWGMCGMDWNTLEKKLREERKLSYTVTYCDRQENQISLEFRGSLTDYEAIGSLRALYQDEAFGIGYYTIYFKQEEEMEAALLRLQEELLTPESRDTRKGLDHFSDEKGNRIELVKQGEENEDGWYIVEIMFLTEKVRWP